MGRPRKPMGIFMTCKIFCPQGALILKIRKIALPLVPINSDMISWEINTRLVLKISRALRPSTNLSPNGSLTEIIRIVGK
jgi:hypothetical protein